jgi:hypothetical protein
MSVNSLNKRDRMLEVLSDFSDISNNGRKQALMKGTHDLSVLGIPQVEEKTEVAAEPLSYRILKPKDVFQNSPHICLLASSGSGKSVMTRFLYHAFLHGQASLIIDPHNSRGLTIESREHGIELLRQLREGEIQKIICGYGRDWLSVLNIIEAMEEELNYRFQNGSDSVDWPMINFWWEELPAIFDGVNEYSKGLAERIIKMFLKESRKVNLRNILITQGEEVRMLGLLNASSLKDGYTFLRLGKKALRHAMKQDNEALKEVLTSDLHKSLALHKKLKSKATFAGTCWLIDDDGYLPFEDISVWNQPIESDILDPHFLHSPSDDTQSDPIENATNATIPHDRDDSEKPQYSGSNQADSLGLGEQRDHSPIDLKPLHSKARPAHATPSPDFPSYRQRWGLNAVVAPPESQSGATFPASKSDGSKTVVIEGIEDFWVSKYKGCKMYSEFENIRPEFVSDEHVAKYFERRGEGMTPSQAAKSLYRAEKYKLGNPWLKEVYGFVSEN